jgi:hypothetical protein
MRRESLVFAFCDKTIYTFERSDEHSASCFGGALEEEFTGSPFGPKPLHLIARLHSGDIPILGSTYVFALPLIYGMHYDGCELSYRVVSSTKIEMLRIAPASSLDDWPYPHFPPLLPYVPLQLKGKPQRSSYDQFASRFPNMPEEAAELMVAVPPPATIGLSLWSGADWDGVTIVFECDLQKKVVNAFNVTS